MDFTSVLGRQKDLLAKSIRFGSKLCFYDVNFEIVSVDDDYANLVGVNPEEKEILLGKTIRDVIHPNDIVAVASEVYGFQRKSKKYSCKYRLKMADESYIWVQDTGEVVEIEGKEYIHSVVVDISVQEELIKQRDITYESVPGGIVYIVVGKDNFYIREANQKYFDLLEASREACIGSSGKFTFPEDLPGLRAHLVTSAQKRESVDYEFRTRKGSTGEISWFRMIGNYYDSREDGEEYLCLMVEITDRKNVEFELMKEKEKYRIAMVSTTGLIYEYQIQEKKFRLFGQNYLTEDTSLCIKDDEVVDYRELLFGRELIYKGDRKKILSFIRNKKQYTDNIRMLTRNKLNGKVYYDNYEFYAHKVYQGRKLIRVVGYVKKISYKTIPVTVKQELHQIFDENLLKDYCFLIKIDVPTESFDSYFIEDCGWEAYRGNRYYDSFLYWWCRNMVAPEEQREMLYFLSLEQMLRVLHSGEPRGYRFCKTKGNDGKYKYRVCYFSFLGSDLNTILLTVKDVHQIRMEDVYQQEENQRILADALTETKDAITSRKSFMNYMVKEINPPIATIKQLLGEETNEETLRQIGRCADYIAEMLESIEEYNQMETPYNRSNSKVNLYDMCTEICDEERKISMGLDISIKENIALEKEQLYYVHEFRFKDILINLLGNAIKYAPSGSEISLYVYERERENDHCTIRITLEDEGPVIDRRFYERSGDYGTEKEIQKKIFALGGAGYSISISGKIASLMGGSIEFRKGVVHNSVVQIDIPVYLSERKEKIVRDPEVYKEGENNKINFQGQGILLVEKENNTNKLLAPLLQVNGAKVYTAKNGKGAMDILSQFDAGIISAILIDHELDDMNCYEFARKIRHISSENMRKIPIMEMQDGINMTDTKEALVSGINAVLSKPVNLVKLAAIIENLQTKI